jgi:hypothetical protein
MKTVCIGIRYDAYTPAVESQLMRDILALQGANLRCRIEVLVENEVQNALLTRLGVYPIFEPVEKANIWIAYQTMAEPVKLPECASQESRTTFVRKLYQEYADGSIDLSKHSGYYLKPNDRPAPPSMLRRAAPSSVGMTDPYIVQRFGR